MTFLKVYMELGSYFLFLQEQIKDIIIMSDAPWLNRRRPGSLYSIIEYEYILLLLLLLLPTSRSGSGSHFSIPPDRDKTHTGFDSDTQKIKTSPTLFPIRCDVNAACSRRAARNRWFVEAELSCSELPCRLAACCLFTK